MTFFKLCMKADYALVFNQPSWSLPSWLDLKGIPGLRGDCETYKIEVGVSYTNMI